MIDVRWIAAPAVGGLIGLITNGIAIKMLFRPFHAVRIGKFTLPFTPGLIPKEQPRLAQAIGKVVGDELLDQDTLRRALSSDTLHDAFERKVNRVIEQMGQEEGTVYEALARRGLSIPADTAVEHVGSQISAYVAERLTEQEIGEHILDYAIEEVLSNMNSMVAMVAEPAIRRSHDAIAARINETIAEQCPGVIKGYLDTEYRKWRDRPVKDAAVLLWKKKEAFKEKVWDMYLELLDKKSARFLKRLDVSSIVEQKINELDMQELEDLILSISRKELRSLVWIGGLLGAVIGFVNLLF